MSNTNLGGSTLGGGPYNGYSSAQTVGSVRDSENVIARRILRSSWNSSQLFAKNGKMPSVGPFRAVNNLGDFFGRVNYSCGGPNPTNASKPGYKRLIGSIPVKCDSTGVEVTSCNPKFVSDSSDYVKFKKLRAMNRNYNDVKGGGDKSHASYVPLMAVRRR
jgi:hypothetical protein